MLGSSWTKPKYAQRSAIVCLLLCASICKCSPLQVSGGCSQQGYFDLAHFDERPSTCRAKGRLQDKEYCDSKTMNVIVCEGKAAVPTLIKALTDQTNLSTPILDYWSNMTVGDVAYLVLLSLFTDADWRTITVKEIPRGTGCIADAQTCWHRFLRTHSRRLIKEQWQALWEADQARLYWDDKNLCFRLEKETTAR